ncbi:hypothetical protein CBG52_03580 [Fusobacterium polymorphum]|uniref:Uncharacterized protein n=1 Tax=Fusobacterium nucleatum subsp. polymorphum TaxID=76857 RepID=A0A2C6C1G1_FUSNP|nr:hypothetical protein CBG52_03580 [Fusobacterium polymorphum]
MHLYFLLFYLIFLLYLGTTKSHTLTSYFHYIQKKYIVKLFFKIFVIYFINMFYLFFYRTYKIYFNFYYLVF